MASSRVRVLLTPRPGSQTPGAARPARDECAVVIDVLRATTTLTVALGHGATRVIPAATPEEAFARRRTIPQALLCGERDGRRIEGFDLGNSPFEYPVPAVSGRPLIFASTNGSQAMIASADARRRLLAAFVNLRAVVERLAGERRIVIVCAGKLGGFALEDAACAGLLVRRLVERGAKASGAEAAFASTIAPRDAAETKALVQGASHGRYLRALGPEFARDVEFCGELDSLDAAWELERDETRSRA
jgi:2-phosphosulfolactate phosphatase